jgi:hypothetical protein
MAKKSKRKSSRQLYGVYDSRDSDGGHVGSYFAESKEGALNECAQNAGYKDWNHVLRRGRAREGDYYAKRIAEPGPPRWRGGGRIRVTASNKKEKESRETDALGFQDPGAEQHHIVIKKTPNEPKERYAVGIFRDGIGWETMYSGFKSEEEAKQFMRKRATGATPQFYLFRYFEFETPSDEEK